MSQRGFSFKRLFLLCTILLPVVVVIYLAVFWTEIQYGLKLPGRVGAAADQYFFNGEHLEPEFDYWTFSLADGSQWKVVEANTDNVRSLPSWLIYMVQGPERQTYVLEQRFEQGKQMDLNKCLSTHTLEPDKLKVARTTAGTILPADSHYLALINASDIASFAAALENLGFRKTSY